MSQHVFHPDGPIQLVMNPLAVKKYDGGMAKNQDAPLQEGNCVRTFGRSNHQLSISGTAKHRGLCEFESSQLADAVAVEPVSTAKFPANREINREFHRIRLIDAILKADTRAKLEACSEIPNAKKTGNYFDGTGNSSDRTGNFTCQNQNHCRMRFSVHTRVSLERPAAGRLFAAATSKSLPQALPATGADRRPSNQ